MKQVISKRESFRNLFRESANRDIFHKKRIKLHQSVMEEEYGNIQVVELKDLINHLVMRNSQPSFDQVYKILSGINMLNDNYIIDSFFIEFVLKTAMLNICQTSEMLSNNLITAVTQQILQRILRISDDNLIVRHVDTFRILCRHDNYFTLFQTISLFEYWYDKTFKEEFIQIFMELINKKTNFDSKQIDIIFNFSQEPEIVDFKTNKLFLDRLNLLLQNWRNIYLENHTLNKIFLCIVELSCNTEENYYIVQKLGMLQKIMEVYEETSELEIKINFFKILCKLSETNKLKQIILTESLMMLLKKQFDENNQQVPYESLVFALKKISSCEIAVNLFIKYQIYERLQYKIYYEKQNTRVREAALYCLINLLWFADENQLDFLIKKGLDSIVYEALATEDNELIKHTLKLIKQFARMDSKIKHMNEETINFDFLFKPVSKHQSIAVKIYQLTLHSNIAISIESKKTFSKYFNFKPILIEQQSFQNLSE